MQQPPLFPAGQTVRPHPHYWLIYMFYACAVCVEEMVPCVCVCVSVCETVSCECHMCVICVCVIVCVCRVLYISVCV